MSRQEEIRNKAVHEQRVLMESMDYRAGFMSGAEWADKTMVKKACEWLEKNYYNVYQGTWQEIKEQFINDFKKAMEE